MWQVVYHAGNRFTPSQQGPAGLSPCPRRYGIILSHDGNATLPAEPVCVALTSPGCAKAPVDSEQMPAPLAEAGCVAAARVVACYGGDLIAEQIAD